MKTNQILMGLILYSLLICPPGFAQSKKPNILFIVVDDLRPELKCFGVSQIKSPNIDKLGVEVINNFVVLPDDIVGYTEAKNSSNPSINATSSRYRKDIDLPEVVSLPMHFKNNGYRTISNGKVYHHVDDDNKAWNEIWRPKGNGLDYQLEKNLREVSEGKRGLAFESATVDDMAYFDGKIANKGITDLNKLKNSKQPFFLALGFKKPHLPFNAPKKYWDLYDRNIALPKSYIQPESTPKKAFHKYGELRNYSGIPKNGHLNHELAKKLIHGYYKCYYFRIFFLITYKVHWKDLA